MATYNGGAFLAAQLASLAHQTQLPDELVLTDDGSSDDTLAAAAAFAATAPFPVKISSNPERLGYTRNFKKAAQSCTGEVIFFCDQDDVWRLDKVERVTAVFQQKRADTVFHDIAIFSNPDGKASIPSYYQYLDSQRFSAVACIKGCSIAVRRDFIDYWGWPEPNSPISYDLWIALLATAFDQRFYLDEILVDHRLHEKNTSGWIASKKDRVWAREDTADVSDTELLIDLCLKRWNLTGTEDLLKIARDKGMGLDAGRAQTLIRYLELNRDRYARHRWDVRSIPHVLARYFSRR